MNALTFIIGHGQLELVYLTNMKTGRKDVNRQVSSPFVNNISIMVS